jgi:hypothetical protein
LGTPGSPEAAHLKLSLCRLADPYTQDVPAFAVGAAAVLILTGLAFVGRVVAVAALSASRPQAASFVTRYWTWLPVLVIGIVVAVLLWPVGLLLAAAAIGLVIAKPDLFGLPPRSS